MTAMVMHPGLNYLKMLQWEFTKNTVNSRFNRIILARTRISYRTLVTYKLFLDVTELR